MIRPVAPMDVPAPTARRVAELLGECATQLSDLLDEDLPADATLPERRRRTHLINRIRIILSSTALLVGVSQVFDPPTSARPTR